MATEVSEKDLDKVRSENEKIRDQIADAERALAEKQRAVTIQNDKALLDQENDRLKARLAELKESLKVQDKSSTPAELAAASENSYEALVKVDGDTPQEAAPEVAPEEKKAGN